MVRIGSGAGFAADRIDPAVRLIEQGRLDWIGFECLAERTLAQAQTVRAADPAKGYNRFLEARMRACLPPAMANGTRIISNMGAANPRAAAEAAARIGAGAGAAVAYVTGDDVMHLIGPDTLLQDIGMTVREFGRPLVSANAYLGVEQILPAIESDATVILTGRTADPSLFLGPLVHAYGWALDDWAHLGAGTLVGHLLECAGQVTGGYFADPGHKDVPGLADLGFPLCEVAADGSATVTKLPTDGGCVTAQTVKEQTLYEVHDPARYLTPDVTANFSRVRVREEGRDRVAIAGATGGPRPDTLKVTVAFDGGMEAEAGISYAGPGAADRARLAADVLRQRLKDIAALRIDLIGVSSLHGTLAAPSNLERSEDVRVRVAARTDDPDTADRVLWEVEALYTCGPAGGGGVRGQVRRTFVTHDAYVPRDAIRAETGVIRP
ncbi:acyclic terpene utilization AtuA family protein [Futiania mangrovi]|uniref:DUF1446 domain-containing protein n=1 Tax=Futiania mangrovi TaxID=2959716 RepID=A0A9J6PKQ6_9PROT|nr:acyclic terpene utilization AtuA family protein [Futiania mangrovii]MCP1336650.1 DUF1446 domain-containing protein [Futiania mangrovii]